MTKHFCDFCKKEIMGTFLGKDILYKINPSKFGIDLSVLILVSQTTPFLMVCEKCIVEKFALFFSVKAKEIAFEENEKLIYKDGCKLQKKKWKEHVFLKIDATKCAYCEFRMYCNHNNKREKTLD